MPTRSAREQAALGLWLTALEGLPDIAARIVPDATDNPLDRLELRGDPQSGFTAAGLAIALAAGDPPIIVRGQEAGRGHFYLDPAICMPARPRSSRLSFASSCPSLTVRRMHCLIPAIPQRRHCGQTNASLKFPS